MFDNNIFIEDKKKEKNKNSEKIFKLYMNIINAVQKSGFYEIR